MEAGVSLEACGPASLSRQWLTKDCHTRQKAKTNTRDCPLSSHACCAGHTIRSQAHTHTQIYEGEEQPALDRPVTDLGCTLDLMWLNTDKSRVRVSY